MKAAAAATWRYRSRTTPRRCCTWRTAKRGNVSLAWRRPERPVAAAERIEALLKKVGPAEHGHNFPTKCPRMQQRLQIARLSRAGARAAVDGRTVRLPRRDDSPGLQDEMLAIAKAKRRDDSFRHSRSRGGDLSRRSRHRPRAASRPHRHRARNRPARPRDQMRDDGGKRRIPAPQARTLHFIRGAEKGALP